MRRLARRLLIPAFVMALLSSQAAAGEILIDFERFPGPDGVPGTADDVPAGTEILLPLTTQYASLGVRFEGASLHYAGFFNATPDNNFISSTRPFGFFSAPVTGISIDSYSSWNATLTAYDQTGAVLASQVLVNPDQGRQPMWGTLSVTSAQPIYSFSIQADHPDWIVNLDNLRLSLPADVPEPGQLALFASGMLLMGGAMRRKTRPRGPEQGQGSA